MPSTSSTSNDDKKVDTKVSEEVSNQKNTSDVQATLEESIAWSKKVFEQNKVIKRRLGIMVFMSYAKLVLVLVPLILALIFLPPLIEDMMQQYNALVGGGDSSVLEQVLEVYGVK